jgi:hypothetical protein
MKSSVRRIGVDLESYEKVKQKAWRENFGETRNSAMPLADKFKLLCW